MRAALLLAGVLALAGCSSEAEIPQDVVTPGPKPVERVPLFTSCLHASIAGAPLPLVVGDPGWNPRLDYDHNGEAC